jgi:hypothetical protein
MIGKDSYPLYVKKFCKPVYISYGHNEMARITAIEFVE